MIPNIDLCRLCAQKKKIKHQIFESTSNLAEIIKDCLNLNITMTDPLPKVLCCECQKCLEQFWAFKRKCIDAELTLTEIAHDQASVKKLATIKQELESADDHNILLSLNLDHTYSSTSPAVRIVKTEVRDDLISIQTNNSQGNEDLYLEDLIQEIPIPDVKQYEIVSLNEDHEEATTINENTLTCQETKPVIGSITNEVEPFPEMWLETIEEKSEAYPNGDFQNEDLVLKDGESCDIDMEEMECVLQKAKNPKMRFKCKICRKSFKFYKGLKKHENSHDEADTLYRCHFCVEDSQSQFQFASLTTLKRHLLIKHLLEGSYKCKICLQSFRTARLYKLHMSTEHGIATFYCHICSRQCSSKSSLTDHLRIHSGLKPYFCTICGKTFSWKSSLASHLRAHKQQKDFLCWQCGLALTSRTALVEHLNIHSGEKPFSCTTCGLSYSHKGTLKRHEASHNLPQYKCLSCNRVFLQPYSLKEHQLTHTGDKPLTCLICNSKFQRKSSLTKHAKLHKSKTYICKYCDFVCHRKDALIAHEAQHTGCRHACPAKNCKRSYTQRISLVLHFKKTHPEMELLGRNENCKNNGLIVYNIFCKDSDGQR